MQNELKCWFAKVKLKKKEKFCAGLCSYKEFKYTFNSFYQQQCEWDFDED